MAKSATVTRLTPKKPIRRKIHLRTPVGKVNTHYVDVDHGGRDPKQDLLDRIGDISPDFVQFSRILVAIYQPPMAHKTAGGILLSDGMKEEDLREYLWQGKVGLIVALGPQAYVDDDTVKFHDTRNDVGDWVWFRPSDGMPCEVNEVMCRVFTERDIIGRIPHPDAIW